MQETGAMTPMERALEQAGEAAARGEIPVGAVVTDAQGRVVAAAGNRTEEYRSPAAHAEMLALREAGERRGQKYLADCTLTVTLEPCAMCAGAIAAYRVKKLVFGAYDPKSGAVEHGPRVFGHATTHHKPEVIGGVRDSDCAALLSAFFAGLRDA
jgi:tRNA(Arg) A34 adenosine deaminase TadA